MSYRIQILSRHASHNVLREQLIRLPFKSRVRLGSVTEKPDDNERVVINSVQAIKNAANKELTKLCFDSAGIKTAPWFIYYGDGKFAHPPVEVPIEEHELIFPLIAKHKFGSRGTGNYLLKNIHEFTQWKEGRALGSYIYEVYLPYVREYRLHVSNNGYFYALRKMLKSDCPSDQLWTRNNNNSVWINEENPKFDKPANWESIVLECVKALDACGLNLGGFDVKVQSAKKRNGTLRSNPKFFIIEVNSAPSLGEKTEEKYLQEIPKLAQTLYERRMTND